jgi:hypothetical protein
MQVKKDLEEKKRKEGVGRKAKRVGRKGRRKRKTLTVIDGEPAKARTAGYSGITRS